MSKTAPQIRYLNTDLCLVSAENLTPLTDELTARGVRPLGDVPSESSGCWYANLEIGECLDTPENTICVMLDALEAIGADAKQLWAACSKREFNIGYDCGDEPWAFNNELCSATVKRIASLNASIVITIYPYRAEPTEKPPKRKQTKRKKP